MNMKAAFSSPKGKSLRSSLLEHTRRTQIEAMESRTSQRVEELMEESLCQAGEKVFVTGGSFLGSTLSALAPVRLGSGVSFTNE